MEPTKPGGIAKPSKVEAIKLASQYLKTFVADELQNGKSHFSEDAATILKFHGSYQQDDRDVRRQLKKEGKEAAHQFMVRVRIVGGQLSARPVPGLRPPGPDDRQRQPANHDPAGVPAPRRLESTICKRPSARSTKPSCRPWRPVATSSATCSAALPRLQPRSATTSTPTR